MPRLRSGGSFATEWGKKGHTLIRIGDDHQNEPERLLAILDECERAGIYAMYTPSMANNIIKTGQSGFDMEGLVSNITLVKDHPALWGYYICDDCCACCEQPGSSQQAGSLLNGGHAYQAGRQQAAGQPVADSLFFFSFSFGGVSFF